MFVGGNGGQWSTGLTTQRTNQLLLCKENDINIVIVDFLFREFVLTDYLIWGNLLSINSIR